MSIADIKKREISPSHPGEMIRKDIRLDFALTATSMAATLEVSRQTIHALLRERRAITPVMGLRLSLAFLEILPKSD